MARFVEEGGPAGKSREEKTRKKRGAMKNKRRWGGGKEEARHQDYRQASGEPTWEVPGR